MRSEGSARSGQTLNVIAKSLRVLFGQLPFSEWLVHDVYCLEPL